MSDGLRIAVVGKGGAGKSVLAGTLARVLARRGDRVLALDSDLMPGLAFSLGAQPPAAPPLADAAERDADGRWRLRKGIGPARAVAQYSTAARRRPVLAPRARGDPPAAVRQGRRRRPRADQRRRQRLLPGDPPAG